MAERRFRAPEQHVKRSVFEFYAIVSQTDIADALRKLEAG